MLDSRSPETDQEDGKCENEETSTKGKTCLFHRQVCWNIHVICYHKWNSVNAEFVECRLGPCECNTAEIAHETGHREDGVPGTSHTRDIAHETGNAGDY